jgi:PadR family transcriptional regulator PadR
VRERPDCGYGLSQRLASAEVGAVPGGTLYPALLRLEHQGRAERSWTSWESGPRRKHYAIDAAGRHVLGVQVSQWRLFNDSIEALLETPAAAAETRDGRMS